MKNLILLPTYNECDNVRLIVPEIFELNPEIGIMVVDDNSPDGTANVVRELQNEYSNLLLQERSNKQGLGAAYIDALTKVLTMSEVDAVMTMDADGSHDPKDVSKLFGYMQTHDMAIGSRYIPEGGVENWEFWRRSLSRYGNLYPSLLAGLGVSDMTSGFTVVKTKILNKIDLSKIGSSGYAFMMEYKFHCIDGAGASAVEHPIIFRSRREGESKFSSHIIAEGALLPLRLLWRRLTKKIS